MTEKLNKLAEVLAYISTGCILLCGFILFICDVCLG